MVVLEESAVPFFRYFVFRFSRISGNRKDRLTLYRGLGTIAALLLVLTSGSLSVAMQPPGDGEIESLRQTGEYAARVENARSLGNHRIDPYLLERAIAKARRTVLAQQGASAAVLDQTVPLPAPPPAWRGMPTTGAVKMFALLIDFSDYPASNTNAAIDSALFGTGSLIPANKPPYESLTSYYKRSSYNQLSFSGGVTLGWYHSAKPRSDIEMTTPGREQLIIEAIESFRGKVDFSQFDNNGDGTIDYFAVIWTGPHTGHATFWWGQACDFEKAVWYDGKKLGKYSWQWEYKSSRYSLSHEGPFSPLVTIHETGHALGLPDYYDYNKSIGPPGGVGQLDMMDESNWGDHNSFSKWVLGWLTPTVVASGSRDLTLNPSGMSKDAVLIMPGATSGDSFREFFIVQNRYRTGNDPADYPANGLLIWHVDARLNAEGTEFQYNNTDTPHKLLKLMEADGLERIDSGKVSTARAGMYYGTGKELTPLSVPSSRDYQGVDTRVSVTNITLSGQQVSAKFSVAATNVLGTLTVNKSGTGDGTVTSVPAGISCGADCAESFTPGGSVMTLTARTLPGAVFTGWSGGGCSGTGSCVVALSGDVVVTAVFTRPFHYIDGGGDHTVVLNVDGTVWNWGSNFRYECGRGDQPGLTGILEVAAGYNHTVALKSDATVWTWGNRSPINVEAIDPVQISGLGNVATITAGLENTTVLKKNGTVWAWGTGYLGDGTHNDSSSPVQVIADTNGSQLPLARINQVASGGTQVIALDEDGRIWAWGWNDYGQLGTGIYTGNSPFAVKVEGVENVVGIAAGYKHSVILKGDQTVLTCGWNEYGQLGVGNLGLSRTPIGVPGLAGVVAVAAGDYHTLALKNDGTVVAWGRGFTLGDGIGVDSSTPVSVAGLTGVVAIAVGGSHSIALDGEGNVWTWGKNNSGQLGVQTSLSAVLRPIKVFSIQGPSPFNKLSPADGAVGQPAGVTLSWEASEGATSYEYRYGTAKDGSYSKDWLSTGTATSVPISGLWAGTTYYWQVRAKKELGTTTADSGAWRSFTTMAPPAAFAKIAPAVNATLVSVNPVLSWGPSAGAMYYEYCLNPVLDTYGCGTPWQSTGTSTTVAVSGLAPNRKYQWYVRAGNIGGEWTYADAGIWSSFTTLPVPGAFGKSAPADGATGVPTDTTLSWASSTGAVRYEYCVDATNDNLCDGGLWKSSGTATSVALSGLGGGAAYFWAVRAVNEGGVTYANGTGAFCWWEFTTAPGKPEAFKKKAPAEAVTGQPISPTLAWGVSAGATKYEYCVDTNNNAACDNSWLSSGTSTSKAISGLASGTKYYWQIRATNVSGTVAADGGVWWNFTTGTVPGQPAIGTATAGNGQVSVGFTPPAAAGSSPVTVYTATSSPGSKTGTGTASPITVTGLTNGTAYTFTVTATNAVGSSGSSAASNAVTPSSSLLTATITATDPTATEAGISTGQFTVTRTGPTIAALTVAFAVTGTATAGSDYSGIGTSVTIPAGASSAKITLTPINETADESDETVVVTLGAAAAYFVGSPSTATVSISDDDLAPMVQFSQSAAIVFEASSAATINVSLSAASGKTVTVNYATANGTAIAGSDYTAAAGTLTFLPGEIGQIIVVPITNDAVQEPVETFTVRLTTPSNATLGAIALHTGSIDDDHAPGAAGLKVIAEAVDQEAWVFTTQPGADWWRQTAVTHDGSDAARSGYLSGNQTSYFQTTGSFGAGRVSFWWKVSSEAGYDFLRFSIDGRVKDEIAGEVDWQQKTYSVAAGIHTLKWEYAKDFSEDGGDDAGWVDQLVLPAAVVLWTRGDTGEATLLPVNAGPQPGLPAAADGTVISVPSVEAGPWEATSSSPGDASTSVLWSRGFTGRAILAPVAVENTTATDTGAASLEVPAADDGPWQAASYSQLDATTGYVLWSRADTGQAILAQVDPGAPGTPVTRWAYLQVPGGVGGPWQATSYTHGAAATGYVLWTRSDTGQAILWRVAPGAISGTIPVRSWAYLESPAGVGESWQATSYTHIDATEGYVLWTRGDTGQAILWRVAPGAVSGTIPVTNWVEVSAPGSAGSPWRAASYSHGATPR